MEIDVVLTTGPPDVSDLAVRLRDVGVDGVATVEGPHDAFFPLVQAAGATDLAVATYVAIAFPRSPVHLAHAAWDLQTISGGRFRLGLGTQVRAHVEQRYGASFDRPVERMAEWVAAIRAVFATWQHGTALRFEGEFTRHTKMPPLLSPPPLEHGPPPILVGALGPRMVAMTTAVADGIVLHPMTSASFLRTTVEGTIADGLAAADRDRRDFEVVGGALVGVHDGGSEAASDVRAGLRGLLAFYGSTPAYRPVLDSIDAGDLQPRLQEMTRNGEWDRLDALVDDRVLDALTVNGTPDEVGAELRERYQGVVDRLSLTFVQALPTDLIGDVVLALR